MNKVYIVQAHFYEDESKVIKSFEDKKGAKNYSEKYERIMKKLFIFIEESYNKKSRKNIVQKYSKHIYNEFIGSSVSESEYIPHIRKRNLEKLV